MTRTVALLTCIVCLYCFSHAIVNCDRLSIQIVLSACVLTGNYYAIFKPQWPCASYLNFPHISTEYTSYKNVRREKIIPLSAHARSNRCLPSGDSDTNKISIRGFGVPWKTKRWTPGKTHTLTRSQHPSAKSPATHCYYPTPSAPFPRPSAHVIAYAAKTVQTLCRDSSQPLGVPTSPPTGQSTGPPTSPPTGSPTEFPTTPPTGPPSLLTDLATIRAAPPNKDNAHTWKSVVTTLILTHWFSYHGNAITHDHTHVTSYLGRQRSSTHQ